MRSHIIAAFASLLLGVVGCARSIPDDLESDLSDANGHETPCRVESINLCSAVGSAEGSDTRALRTTFHVAISKLRRGGGRIAPFMLPAAHRGSHADAPGNSLPAIADAVKMCVPFVEIDVRRSRTGSFFLFHDKMLTVDNVEATDLLHRTSDSLSDDEWLRLSPRGHPELAIATLAEALRIVHGTSTVLLLDLKGDADGYLGDLTDFLAQRSALADVVLQLRTVDAIRRVRERVPQAAVLARVEAPGEIEKALRFRPEILQGDAEFLSAVRIGDIRRAGVLVLLKSLGKERDLPRYWGRLCAQGVDLILTDVPNSMLKWRDGQLEMQTKEMGNDAAAGGILRVVSRLSEARGR